MICDRCRSAIITSPEVLRGHFPRGFLCPRCRGLSAEWRPLIKCSRVYTSKQTLLIEFSLHNKHLLWHELYEKVANIRRKGIWDFVGLKETGYLNRLLKYLKHYSLYSKDQIFSTQEAPPLTWVRWEGSQHVKKAKQKIPESKRIDLLRSTA